MAHLTCAQIIEQLEKLDPQTKPIIFGNDKRNKTDISHVYVVPTNIVDQSENVTIEGYIDEAE